MTDAPPAAYGATRALRLFGTSTGAYRLHYLKSRVAAMFARATPEYDVVFVLNPAWPGWILEGICRELASHVVGRCHFHYGLRELPAAKAYFVTHQSLVADVLTLNPAVWHARRVGFYTHPSDIFISQAQYIYALNQLHGLLFMCSAFQADLIRSGVAAERTAVVHAGADPTLFRPHERSGGAVGLCAAYYDRKGPDRIVEIVRRMPHRKFIMLGRGWKTFAGFDALVGSGNFEYAEVPYETYPSYYARMDVFLSLSRLEGGPVPLLEAMMSNVVPVATKTGFAPDIISHGRNGFLCDVDASPDRICPLVDAAFEFRGDVAGSVAHLTWDRFAQQTARWLGVSVATK